MKMLNKKIVMDFNLLITFVVISYPTVIYRVYNVLPTFFMRKLF